MGDLKPVGSEKLQLEEKIKRINEIGKYGQVKKQPLNVDPTSTVHLVKEAKDGFYSVVREKDGYYVKFGLNESEFDYIGGMMRKNKNKFGSYAEAVKRLELIAIPKTKTLKEQMDGDKKYVLKNKGGEEGGGPAPMDAPAPEGGEEPMGDMGDEGAVDDFGGGEEDPSGEFGGEPTGEEGGEPMGDDFASGGEVSLKMKIIQKLTGKLGQKLRGAADELQSDDIKYVLNSVIAAVDIDKLTPEDKDEILGKFEDLSQYDDDSFDELDSDSELGGEGSEDLGGGDEMGGEDLGSEEGMDDMGGEEERDEIYENLMRVFDKKFK